MLLHVGSAKMTEKWAGQNDIDRYWYDCGAAVCRSVLAQAIFDDLLKCYGRHLDVRVESASVGPAPPGEDRCSQTHHSCQQQ